MAPVHAHEGDRAVVAARSGMAKRLSKEPVKAPSTSRHAHGELAMADAAEPADMAVDRNVVGWVGEDEVGTLALQQTIEGLSLSGIAADEPMTIKQPYLSSLVIAVSGSVRGGIWSSGPPAGAEECLRFVQQQIDFGKGEARDLNVEVDIDKGLQFDREQSAIPAGVQASLLSAMHVSSALRRIEVGQPNRRDALQAHEPGCLDSAMAGDDLVIIADQHRIGEAELLNAIGNLPDLLLGMGTRIPCIGSQACDRQRFNDHGLHVLPLLLKAPIGKTESRSGAFGVRLARAKTHSPLADLR